MLILLILTASLCSRGWWSPLFPFLPTTGRLWVKEDRLLLLLERVASHFQEPSELWLLCWLLTPPSFFESLSTCQPPPSWLSVCCSVKTHWSQVNLKTQALPALALLEQRDARPAPFAGSPGGSDGEGGGLPCYVFHIWRITLLCLWYLDVDIWNKKDQKYKSVGLGDQLD